MKPHKAFLEGFMKKMQEFDKSKMLIIGDELQKDVKIGVENGIDSCWFHWKKENMGNILPYMPTYEITNLWELKHIL